MCWSRVHQAGLGGISRKRWHERVQESPLGARRTDQLQTLVKEIRSDGGGGEAIALALDVSSRQSVVACFDNLADQFGGLDVVVNNAGVSDTKAALDYTDDDWDSILHTNLKGAWMVSREGARWMVKNGGGSIINVTSILSSRLAV